MQNNPTRTTVSAGNVVSRARRRILIYGTVLLLLCLAQTTIAPLFPVLGMTPDLCLLFVLGVAFFDGPVSGGGVGIAAGFLESALGGIGLSVYPLLFFAVGYGIGRLSGRALPRNFPSYLILATALCILRPFVTLAAIALGTGASGFDLPAIMTGTLAPEALANFLVSLLMYPIARKVDKWIQKKS